MGVKTLDPSDYALVSSVTTHLSGVQLLPTVIRCITEVIDIGRGETDRL